VRRKFLAARSLISANVSAGRGDETGKKDSAALCSKIVDLSEKTLLLFEKDDKKTFASPLYRSPSFVLIGNGR
jgi:hypothetical protein